ncbi:MAG: sulfatase-like hydrolase/transferase, partial [Verrucomicrobiota bacterium]
MLADDMGYGDLGCYGNPVIKSPHLDRLAREGVRLLDCYAASPNCSPARTGILTGRSPYRVGMYDFARFKPMHIPETETTVAELLKDAGYQTMFAGKWHCSGDFANQPHPGKHGFDHWLAHPKNFGRNPSGFFRNGEALDRLNGWMAEIVVDETIEWLKQRNTKKPFLTMLWFSEPHTPVLAEDRFKAMYETDETKRAADKLTFGGPQVKRKPDPEQMSLYFGCVSMLDHHIGRLLDFLDKENLAKDTLVVFTSDNGPEHRTRTGYGSPGSLRGAKGHMHEGGYRVPGILRWPGRIKAGTTSREPINGTDFLPTFAHMTGQSLPDGRPMDGANVLPALLEGRKTNRPIPMMWWLWHARGGKEVTMRDGDYKLLANMWPQPNPGEISDTKAPEGVAIMDFIKKSDLAHFEMYNLAVDPNETKEISTVEPERFEALKKKMIRLHRDIRDEGPVYPLGGSKKRK